MSKMTDKAKRAIILDQDTNRKIRKTEFIYICGSQNGSSSSAVNTDAKSEAMRAAYKRYCAVFMSC